MTEIMPLPEEFINRLSRIVPSVHLAQITQSFNSPKILTLRLNKLKVSAKDTESVLQGLGAEPIHGIADAFYASTTDATKLRDDDRIKDGRIYLQNVSSLLAAEILDPKPGERVLDLCAAPGSKTTHIAQSVWI